MNPRYRETFSRHRGLFLLPVALGVVAALLMSLGSPKLYESSTALWSATAGGPTTDFSAPVSPAAQDQATLNELLTFTYFQRDVAANSPLGRYLKTHSSTGFGPVALLKRVLGKSPSQDERIATALGPKRVVATVRGQNALEISFEAPDPKLAQATLRALVKQFLHQRGALARSAVTSAQNQVRAASATLKQARVNLEGYLRTHPYTTADDPQRQALANAVHSALVQLSGATSSVSQALGAVAGGAGLQSTLTVHDPATLPAAPTAGKKRVLMSILAGAFAGALVSVVGLVLLTKAGNPPPPPGGTPELDEHASNGHHPTTAAAPDRVGAELWTPPVRDLEEIHRE